MPLNNSTSLQIMLLYFNRTVVNLLAKLNYASFEEQEVNVK